MIREMDPSVALVSASPAARRPRGLYPADVAKPGLVAAAGPDTTAVPSGACGERTAVVNERRRIARELHDGLLQSLTGAALQLEAMLSLVERDPHSARERLRDIQKLIADEQRAVRQWVDSLRRESATTSDLNLADSLGALCRRVSQSGLGIELLGPVGALVPARLRYHVYRLVQEGLSNIARHAHAERAWVEVHSQHDRVRVVLEDNGQGFAFHGRFELGALRARARGPVSLTERIDSLAGKLVLTSSPRGSRIEMTIPCARYRSSASRERPHPT
jgi:signal transduction histidine kinase